MYSKILVPIHLGEAGKAKLMLDAARQLADAGAAIVLVNVVEEVPAYVAAELPRGLMESSREEAVRRLEELAGREGIAATVDVRIGHPASTILAAAEEHGSDVIIIASHRPGFQDYLIGSTAGRVVRHAPCSVLVIR